MSAHLARYAKKRTSVCDIIDHDDTMRTAVVCGRDRAEPFLSSSVPQCEFDELAIKVDERHVVLEHGWNVCLECAALDPIPGLEMHLHVPPGSDSQHRL